MHDHEESDAEEEKINLDTVGQRMIPGGSTDKWLTDVGTASFVPTSVSRLSSLHSYHG